jgi:TRAP-type C4-dicarboxylate transport system permease small subunit
MFVLITIEIILRNIFNASTLVADEMTGYLMVGVIYWGTILSFETGNFIRVTAIYERFNPKIRHGADIVYYILFISYNALVTYYTGTTVYSALKFGTVSTSIIQVPLFIPKGVMFLGLFFFELYLIVKFYFLLCGKEFTVEKEEEVL